MTKLVRTVFVLQTVECGLKVDYNINWNEGERGVEKKKRENTFSCGVPTQALEMLQNEFVWEVKCFVNQQMSIRLELFSGGFPSIDLIRKYIIFLMEVNITQNTYTHIRAITVYTDIK